MFNSKFILGLILTLFTSCAIGGSTNSISEFKAEAKSESKSLIFQNSFEEPEALSKWERGELPNNSAVTISTSPVKFGKYSAKFTLNQTDKLVAGSKRAELKLNEKPLPPIAERWYGLSVFLPDSFIVDPVPESIFQWHQVPNFKAGETWSTIRPTALYVKTENGRLGLVHSFYSIPSDPKSPGKSKRYDLGEYKTGVWTDFVMHIKFTYKEDGILEMWKNGLKILTINGPTYYNDESGPYFKMGIYKWGWAMDVKSTTTQRIVYYDEIKIGNENSSYDEVAPKSNKN